MGKFGLKYLPFRRFRLPDTNNNISIISLFDNVLSENNVHDKVTIEKCNP